MRKIKFRGVCPNTDEVVVGSLLILHNEWFIVQSVSYQPPYASSSFYHTIQIYPSRTKKEHILAYPVDPDTVEQFVGYDADGKEVYEGDILIDDNGDEHIAGFKCAAMLLDDNENTFVDIEDLQLKGARRK